MSAPLVAIVGAGPSGLVGQILYRSPFFFFFSFFFEKKKRSRVRWLTSFCSGVCMAVS